MIIKQRYKFTIKQWSDEKKKRATSSWDNLTKQYESTEHVIEIYVDRFYGLEFRHIHVQIL